MSKAGLLNTRGGGDSPFLLQRLQQLETAVLDGHFPVRWMPDANYGYGYPFFNFYAPLSIYTAAGFRLLGFSYVRAVQMAQLLGFLVAAWGMFTLAGRWFKNEWAGLITAVSYTVAPFHLVNIYVRGDSLAEFWAMAFYPLVILTAADLFENPPQYRRSRMAAFAVAYAGLILSHNISALIFSPFLLLFISLKLYHQRSIRLLAARLIPAFILGLGLAAWFFLPALLAQDLAQLDRVTEGYFNYNTHFLATEKLPLVQNSFFFDYRVTGRTAFRMGSVQAITAVFTFFLLFLGWRQKRLAGIHTLFISSTVIISTFMMIPASVWLWQNLPLLSFTQFPWRFLSVQAFALALATGTLVWLPNQKWVISLAALLLVVTSLGNIRTDHLILQDEDITAEKLAQYEWFTGNIGTTVSAEYLPPTVQPRAYTSQWLLRGERDQLVDLSGGVVSYHVLKRRTTNQVWQIETAVPSTVILPLLEWPGWQAAIDGIQLAHVPAPGSGLMMLDLPPGNHTLDIQLRRTPVHQIADYLSLLSLATLGILLFPRLVALGQAIIFSSRRIRLGISLSALIFLVMGLHLWPHQQLPQNNLTWDFATMAYLHHDQKGTIYDNGVRLTRYTYSTETVKAGETLTIDLTWENGAPNTTLSLVTPARNRPEFDPPAPAILTAESANGRFNLIIPQHTPAGLYLPRLEIDAGRAVAESTATRGAIHLRPLQITNDHPVTGTEPDVAAVAVEWVTDELLRVILGWQLPQPVSKNYNLSLRLTDANGQFLQLVDRQPGYGLLPTSSWAPDQRIYDWHLMPFPSEQHETPYILLAQLYDIETERPFLTRRLGSLSPDTQTFIPSTPNFSLPAGFIQEPTIFGDQIQLAGYAVEAMDDSLQLTLVWQALADTQTDFTRFVHFVDFDTSPEPLYQVDSRPQHNTYPTSQWVPGEVVIDQIQIPTTEFAAGGYQLSVGFYEVVEGNLPRLTAVDPETNLSLPDNQVTIAISIE